MFGLNKVSTKITEMRNKDGVHFEKFKVKLAKKISVPPMGILRATAITSIPSIRGNGHCVKREQQGTIVTKHSCEL